MLFRSVRSVVNPALESLRYHVSGAIERGEGVAITEQRADAKITELIRDVNDGDCALSAIFDDGSTRKLFNFYIDELAFFDADLIGKTEIEAHLGNAWLPTCKPSRGCAGEGSRNWSPIPCNCAGKNGSETPTNWRMKWLTESNELSPVISATI